MTVTVLVLVLVGCTAQDPTGPTGPAGPDGSTPILTDPDAPWTIPADEVPTEVSVGALEDAVQDALVRVATFDPEPVLAAYRDLAAGADAACPAFFLSGDVTYWLDTCTAASGTSFDGFGVDQRQVSSDGAVLFDVETVGGVASVASAEASLSLDGFVQRQITDDGGVRTTTLFVSGSFETDHPAAAGTWLGEGVEPDLFVTRYEFGPLLAAVIADGALVGLPGALPVVAFDEVALVDPSSGIADCGAEPTGTISVLGEDGAWIDLVFDPVLTGDVVVTAPGACDGCARAWAGATDLGRVCVDFPGAWL